MNAIKFGADIRVHDLSPNNLIVVNAVNSQAARLAQKYKDVPKEDLKIDLSGNQINWRARNTYSPTVNCLIQVRTAKKDQILQTELFRNMSYDLFNEPIWRFFRRIQKQTDALINAANLKPNNKKRFFKELFASKSAASTAAS